MKSYYIEKDTEFSEKTLKTGWAKRQFDISNKDHIIGFSGPYTAIPETKEHIPYCPKKLPTMGHLRVEHHGIGKEDAFIRLRFLVAIIRDTLGDGFSRQGTIITYNQSPITISHIRYIKNTFMFHVGIFTQDIDESTSLINLDNFDITPKSFLLNCSHQYCKEIKEINTICNPT